MKHYPWNDEPRELVTGLPQHIIGGVIRALETAGAAMEVSGATESPIEEIFAGALTAELRRRYEPQKFGVFNPTEPDEHPFGCILLIAQYALVRFRYDFAMRVQGFKKPFLLIECDGKQFHSNPEQMANDRLKDECAFRNAIPMLRFTGGDIHYRIEKCVGQVVKLLEETK